MNINALREVSNHIMNINVMKEVRNHSFYKRSFNNEIMKSNNKEYIAVYRTVNNALDGEVARW